MKHRHSFICGLICGFFCLTVILLTNSTTPVIHTFPPVPLTLLNGRSDIAKELFKNVSNVRVICWIMTQPSNLKTKAIHVKNTWAKHCDKVLYASDKQDTTFPTIPINITKGREHNTMKTIQTFDYIYKYHLEDAEWFMKADDDTYVIIENLKYFLSSEDPSQPLYFGHHLNWEIRNGYHSGGSGYVISKEALKRFGERPRGFWGSCAKDGKFEDVKWGSCMRKLNVKLGDTRDKLGRYRFYPFEMEKIINNNFDEWYYKYAKYGAHVGMESLSEYPISFHYIKPYEMYMYEYFIYHVKAFGNVNGIYDLNRNT